MTTPHPFATYAQITVSPQWRERRRRRMRRAAALHARRHHQIPSQRTDS